MKKSHFVFTGVVLLLVAGLYIFAKETDPFSQISYPVTELNNCQNQSDCESFCDQTENVTPCLDFAEAHGLIPQEELAMARKMLALGETSGPGNCRGKTECQAYCDNINHIEECFVFGEKHGLIPADELAEGKKVMAAIKQGIKPPNCRNKRECDSYCSLSKNMEECLIFGEAAGLIPQQELVEAKMVLAAVKKGAKLPNCRGKKDCDVYCSQDEHFKECLNFAEAAGFMSPEEAAMARKTGGKGPGNCRGKETCDAYCGDPNHAEECVDFAVRYGFMPVEEAEQAKKMMKLGIKGGPGNCRGREECENYCNDPGHLVECVDFAEKAGFMKPKDAARARKMAKLGIVNGPGGCKNQEECEAFCQNPKNGEICLDFAVRAGDMSLEEAAKAKRGMKMMQKGGLGGCQSESECKAYCEDPSHGQECFNFAVENNLISPQEIQKIQEMQQSQMKAFEKKSPTSQEEIEKETEKRFQEEYQKQLEQIEPGEPEQTRPLPVENKPQSLLQRAQNFLAGLLFSLLKSR